MKIQTHKIMVWLLCLSLFIGFIFVGNSDVLCVGEDGHIEFETECLPCCRVIDDVCRVDVLKDLHDKHDDCTNCLDLVLDGPFWSRRYTKINLFQPVKLLTVPTFENTFILAATDNNDLQVNISFLTFCKCPQYTFIAATILRC